IDGSSASTIHHVHQEAASSSRESNASKKIYSLLVSEYGKRARGNTLSSELGRYGASDFVGQMTIKEFENLDILGWWKERESQFPVLAAMARDLLSVQASTVASKSAFFDHLDSMERIQHLLPLEGESEQVEEQIHAEEIAMNLTDPIDEEE
ncbi:zinc finger BED domain-containing protein RICESLEEPER 2-like protein, partial [Tanacetum coccineum]